MLRIREVILLGNNYPDIAIVVEENEKEGFNAYVQRCEGRNLKEILFSLEYPDEKTMDDVYAKTNKLLLGALDGYKVMCN